MEGNFQWDMVISIVVSFVLTIGCYLLSDLGKWSWSLKRRAYLRNGIAESLNKSRSMKTLFSGSRKSVFIENTKRMIRKHQEQKMDREILESITFLRNLAVLNKSVTGSSDFMIEKLSEYHGSLQPVFIKMLKLLRVNKAKEAAELFAKTVGTPAGKEFAGLMIRWDKLEPDELIETLYSHEKSMKAIRMTEQKRRDEIISDLIYFPVVINILVIFINFIYIAYFIDQKEMLQMFIS